LVEDHWVRVLRMMIDETKARPKIRQSGTAIQMGGSVSFMGRIGMTEGSNLGGGN